MPSSGAADRHGRRAARTGLLVLDRVLDTFALTALVSMVVVVCWQVFGRYVLHSSPRWAPEIALVLLGWVAFLGIAIGIRERSHISVGLVVDRMPGRLGSAVRKLGPLLMLGFGIYLTVQGWDFTRVMARNVMPSTGLPRSLQYAAMPVSGVLIALYALLDLLGVPTQRHAQPGGDVPWPPEPDRPEGSAS